MPAKIILTEDQEQEIKFLYTSGKTMPQIVQLLSYKYATVRRVVSTTGAVRDRGNIDLKAGTKICVRCRLIKPLIEYNKSQKGYRPECKDCRAIRAKATSKKYQELSFTEKKTLLEKNRAIKLRYPERLLLKFAKARAKKMELPFNLVETDIVIPSKCPILGIPLQFNRGSVKDNSVTLDRIICSLGYVPGNIQVISWKANKLKSHGTLTEFELIVNYLKQHECKVITIKKSPIKLLTKS